MSSKINEVMKNFGPFDCTPAILSAWCEDFGLEKKTALRLSCGFAAGMARLGHICGAVTGAYLVIGLKYGKCEPDEIDAKEKTFELIQEFDRVFTKKYGTTSCKELLGVEFLRDDPELCKRRVGERCAEIVKDTAEILEGILERVL